MKVLTLLRNASVSTETKQCGFLTNTIYYLRHVNRNGYMEIAPHTTDGIRGLQESRKPHGTSFFPWTVSCFLVICSKRPKIGSTIEQKTCKEPTDNVRTFERQKNSADECTERITDVATITGNTNLNWKYNVWCECFYHPICIFTLAKSRWRNE